MSQLARLCHWGQIIFSELSADVYIEKTDVKCARIKYIIALIIALTKSILLSCLNIDYTYHLSFIIYLAQYIRLCEVIVNYQHYQLCIFLYPALLRTFSWVSALLPQSRTIGT